MLPLLYLLRRLHYATAQGQTHLTLEVVIYRGINVNDCLCSIRGCSSHDCSSHDWEHLLPKRHSAFGRAHSRIGIPCSEQGVFGSNFDGNLLPGKIR